MPPSGGLSAPGGSAGPAYSGVTFAPVYVNSVATPSGGSLPGFAGITSNTGSITNIAGKLKWPLVVLVGVLVWFFFIRK